MFSEEQRFRFPSSKAVHISWAIARRDLSCAGVMLSAADRSSAVAGKGFKGPLRKLAFLKGSHSLLFTLYTNFQGNLENLVFFIYALTAAGTLDSLLFISQLIFRQVYATIWIIVSDEAKILIGDDTYVRNRWFYREAFGRADFVGRPFQAGISGL